MHDNEKKQSRILGGGESEGEIGVVGYEEQTIIVYPVHIRGVEARIEFPKVLNASTTTFDEKQKQETNDWVVIQKSPRTTHDSIRTTRSKKKFGDPKEIEERR